MKENAIAPKGNEVFALMYNNHVDNYKQDTSPKINFPSIYQLAKMTVNETSPILTYEREITND